MPILAIDQGTTSTRALCVGDDGRVTITQVVKHRQFYPQPGWVEHDPDELIASIETCLSTSPPVDAMGIDNQGESCLAWHAETKQAISPVIVWQDNRTQSNIEQLRKAGHEARVLELSGLPLDPYFSASKLAWIVTHIPGAKTLLHQGKLRLGTTDAFFMDRLAGKFITDITTASRTALMNLQTGHWDRELCALFHVPLAALPEIVPTTGALATITSQGRSIPVTASVVDQQASLYGHGCRNKGDAKITFGTGAFALSITGSDVQRSPEQGLLPTIAWQHSKSPPVYALDGGVYCAGSAVEWGRKMGLFDDYAQINQFQHPAAIERDLVFVPALAGLACPHWDRRAAGIWAGLSLETTKQDLMQSILEGVAFRAGEVIDAMSTFTRVADSISIDGGVSVNPYFCQFLANVLSRTVRVKPMAELTAIGTAQLAGADKISLQPHNQPEIAYQPDGDFGKYHKQFKRAIDMARGWRQ